MKRPRLYYQETDDDHTNALLTIIVLELAMVIGLVFFISVLK